jgi:hypothetical protein
MTITHVPITHTNRNTKSQSAKYRIVASNIVDPHLALPDCEEQATTKYGDSGFARMTTEKLLD